MVSTKHANRHKHRMILRDALHLCTTKAADCQRLLKPLNPDTSPTVCCCPAAAAMVQRQMPACSPLRHIAAESGPAASARNGRRPSWEPPCASAQPVHGNSVVQSGMSLGICEIMQIVPEFAPSACAACAPAGMGPPPQRPCILALTISSCSSNHASFSASWYRPLGRSW